MRARPLLSAVVVVATMLAAVASISQADFAAAEGFSGRNGFTCVACHVPTLSIIPAAQVEVAGLPAEWEPGQSYALTIRVTGGPPALPAPAPQGGFEIAVDTGRFSIPPEMEGLLRQPAPDQITYTPAGTLMRTWRVDWTAPDVSAMREVPGDATMWVAAVAANGNHNAQLNISDGGEHGDSTASAVLLVSAAASALRAWTDAPLLAPVLEQTSVDVGRAEQAVVAGVHTDANATHVAWRLDGGLWLDRETTQTWRITLHDLAPGHHFLEVRSEGTGRTSAPVAVDLDVEGGLFDRRGTPGPSLVVVAAGVFTALLLRRTRP